MTTDEVTMPPPGVDDYDSGAGWQRIADAFDRYGVDAVLADPDLADAIMKHLDDTRRCPEAVTCATCEGTTDLAVATVETPVGVYCTTLCGRCGEAGNMPRPPSWVTAINLVNAHCEHLGVTADEMAALLEADRANDADGW